MFASPINARGATRVRESVVGRPGGHGTHRAQLTYS